MKPNEKKMLLALVILLVGLSAKSIWIDPFHSSSHAHNQYAEYARLMAPFQQQTTLDRMKVLNYRTVDVQRESDEGLTNIVVLEPENENIKEIEIKGEYSAKVRAYLLWVFPTRDIRIEGGFSVNESATNR
ncbi:hypothetical protein [Tindallia californiensis]|uniref:Uncharacterized protein n=1 Tax=Tindallia californiensis TaxID=159292 RepID=A0A1H3R8J7_9FIRM|nr:hypothetical protein [Tindallia californiensis]SDZ21990.1 hypothetical protein SAMN05192546_1146 [Tindallia californiensis]